MSAGKVFPNSLTIYKIHELRKEKLFIHERTSKAIVMLVIGEHLGECPPTDEGLCVGCEHRTHGYAIPGLPEKLKGRSVGNRVGWWWEVIKEQPHRHQQGYLTLSYLIANATWSRFGKNYSESWSLFEWGRWQLKRSALRPQGVLTGAQIANGTTGKWSVERKIIFHARAPRSDNTTRQGMDHMDCPCRVQNAEPSTVPLILPKTKFGHISRQKKFQSMNQDTQITVYMAWTRVMPNKLEYVVRKPPSQNTYHYSICTLPSREMAQCSHGLWPTTPSVD